MQSSWKSQALHTEMSIWDSTFMAQKLGLSFLAISRHILKIASFEEQSLPGGIYTMTVFQTDIKRIMNEKTFFSCTREHNLLLIISLYIKQGHLANLRGFGQDKRGYYNGVIMNLFLKEVHQYRTHIHQKAL